MSCRNFNSIRGTERIVVLSETPQQLAGFGNFTCFSECFVTEEAKNRKFDHIEQKNIQPSSADAREINRKPFYEEVYPISIPETKFTVKEFRTSPFGPRHSPTYDESPEKKNHQPSYANRHAPSSHTPKAVFKPLEVAERQSLFNDIRHHSRINKQSRATSGEQPREYSFKQPSPREDLKNTSFPSVKEIIQKIDELEKSFQEKNRIPRFQKYVVIKTELNERTMCHAADPLRDFKTTFGSNYTPTTIDRVTQEKLKPENDNGNDHNSKKKIYRAESEKVSGQGKASKLDTRKVQSVWSPLNFTSRREESNLGCPNCSIEEYCDNCLEKINPHSA